MTQVHTLHVSEGDVVLVGVVGTVAAFHTNVSHRSDLQKVFDAVTEKTGIHFVVVPGLEEIKSVVKLKEDGDDGKPD